MQVAIIGSTNVGKSSLLNRLIQEKNSIVSPRPHTTRTQVLGAVNIDNTQVVFIDTPGYVKHGANIWAEHFIQAIDDAVQSVDVILLVIDAQKPNATGTAELLKRFADNPKTIIALNKVDLRARGRLYPVIRSIADAGYDDIVYLVSSLTKDGINDLIYAITQKATDSEWLFEDVNTTKLSKEAYAAECVREKAFYCLYQEVPFFIWTVPTNAKFRYDKSGAVSEWRVDVSIIVPKQTHKKIVVGRSGEIVKRIGIAARTELESIWGPGQLFLNVVVNSEWMESPEQIKEICLGIAQGL